MPKLYLTFTDSKTARPVAILHNKEKSKDAKNKLVYLDFKNDANRDEFKYDEETLRELLKMEHGAKAVKYRDAMHTLENNISRLTIPQGFNGAFLPLLPGTKEGERVAHYISGQSGSGKTYLAREIAKLYEKIGMKVIMISPVTDHGMPGDSMPIDKLVDFDTKSDSSKEEDEFNQLVIRYRNKKSGLTPEKRIFFENMILKMKPKTKKKRFLFMKTKKCKAILKKPERKLFIFDDNEAAEDTEKVLWLQNQLLLTGRHDSAYMIVINHLANNGNKTRNIIQESHTYTFFTPYNQQTDYFLKKYGQLDIHQRRIVKKVLNSSRYCTIYRLERIILGQDQVYRF